MSQKRAHHVHIRPRAFDRNVQDVDRRILTCDCARGPCAMLEQQLNHVARGAGLALARVDQRGTAPIKAWEIHQLVGVCAGRQQKLHVLYTRRHGPGMQRRGAVWASYVHVRAHGYQGLHSVGPS